MDDIGKQPGAERRGREAMEERSERRGAGGRTRSSPGFDSPARFEQHGGRRERQAANAADGKAGLRGIGTAGGKRGVADL